MFDNPAKMIAQGPATAGGSQPADQSATSAASTPSAAPDSTAAAATQAGKAKGKQQRTGTHEDIESVLISREDLARRVRELADELRPLYAGTDLVLVGVLKGAIMFMTDLARELRLPLEMDFMAVSSYGNATQSSGVVRINKDLDSTIEGRNVLLVEDIVDSGHTLRYLLENLRNRNPASLRVCALLDKQVPRKADVAVEHVGFTIPNRFVVGYGLDFAEHYRNLPYIGVLKPSAYAS